MQMHDSISSLEGFQNLKKDDDIPKVSYGDELTVWNTTAVKVDTGVLEVLKGLNVFKQTGTDLQYILRLDYDGLLLPGALATPPVTCVKEDGCIKSDTPQEIDYFGMKIKQAYPTDTFLNMGDVKTIDNLANVTKAKTFIVDSDMKMGALGLGFFNTLYSYIRESFEIKAGDFKAPVIISYSVQTEQVDVPAPKQSHVDVSLNDSEAQKNSYTDGDANKRWTFKSGKVNINKYYAVGCSSNNTLIVPPTTEEKANGVVINKSTYYMKGDLTYDGTGSSMTQLKGNVTVLVNGPFDDSYFLVQKRDEYIKAMNQAIC
jgi:hypothetical protein